MSQSPCFDIEYWWSYRLVLPRKLNWMKIQTNTIYNKLLYFSLIFNRIIFHLDGFHQQPHHPYFSYGIIHQLQLEYFIVVEISPWSFHFSFWTFFFDTIVIRVFQGILKTLNEHLFPYEQAFVIINSFIFFKQSINHITYLSRTLNICQF